MRPPNTISLRSHLRRPRRARRIIAGIAALTLLGSLTSHAPVQAAKLAPITDGNARFQVLTPTLIRLEYAADGQNFEDGHTINIQHRPSSTNYRTYTKNGYRYIVTPKITMRYKRDSGHFTEKNVQVTVKRGGKEVTANPSWNVGPDDFVVPHNQLGGWRRDLRDVDGPVPLNPGVLSRDGWQLVVDSSTALWEPGSWPKPRPYLKNADKLIKNSDQYQDGYFFGYGLDYRQGLRDLAAITGPSPVLPMWAFGNWYSNYWAHTRRDYENINGEAQRTGTPLDVMVVDTDYKSPNSWNGWNWNTLLWPNPAEQIKWMESLGWALMFNTHDGMNDNDPKFPIVQKRLNNGLYPNGPKWWDPFHGSYGFDMSDPNHAREFYWLHEDFEKAGVNYFWFDYGSAIPLEEGLPLEKGLRNELPSTGVNGVTMKGMNAEQWHSYLYAQRLRARNLRGFSLSRHRGQLAERLNNVHFTGDTKSTWATLEFEAEFTAAEGAAMGLPYVSHDIGGFKRGTILSDDMYVRWAQFGAFQPINRPHGNHAKRMPWQYGPEAEKAGVYFLKLRSELMPYLYNLAWEAHLTGIPMARALYLNYPTDPEAYRHNTEYLLGDDILVTPAAQPGKTVTQEVYFPEGKWRDMFTGKVYEGRSTHQITTDWMSMPVFIREGAIITTMGGQAMQDGKNWEQSRKDLYGISINALSPNMQRDVVLYQDDGKTLGYLNGEVARTPLSLCTDGNGNATVTIGKTEGSFPGMSGKRTYRMQLNMPSVSTVTVNGKALKAGTKEEAMKQPGQYFWFDAQSKTVYFVVNGVANGSEAVVKVNR